MKGIDFVIKKTAAQLNLPEDKVKIIIMQYWKTIYHKILKVENTTITVRHLGNFTISNYKLKRLIKDSICKIRNFRKTDKLTPERKKEAVEYELARLKLALARRNELATMFKEAKDAKKILRKNKNEQNKRLSEDS